MIIPATESPDGRPGVGVLLFAISPAELQKQLQNRVGQCVLTCPGTACYAGIASGAKLKLGSTLRYFGDGWRSRSGSAAGATGASRSWRASSFARRAPAAPPKRWAAAISC